MSEWVNKKLLIGSHRVGIVQIGYVSWQYILDGFQCDDVFDSPEKAEQAAREASKDE